jgi:hypothetical protein
VNRCQGLDARGDEEDAEVSTKKNRIPGEGRIGKQGQK